MADAKENVESIVNRADALYHDLGFGTVTRLPDQPATESDE